MDCEEFRNQFTDYLNGTLEESAVITAETHLAGCAPCRDEAAALKEVWTRLGSFPSEEPDSRAMRARFDVMVDAYRQGMEHAPGSGWWSAMNSWIGAWWPRQPALQFGLAVVLFIGGLASGNYFRPAPAPPSDDLNQLRAELQDTRQMVALSLMQQQSATERLRGVSWSNQMDNPGAEVLSALLDTLMHDPNVNVRLAAVDAVKKFGESQVVRRGTLQALMQQDNPAVQVALIDLMVELQERDSIDTLQMFARDVTANEAVRQRAVWSLGQF